MQATKYKCVYHRETQAVIVLKNDARNKMKTPFFVEISF